MALTRLKEVRLLIDDSENPELKQLLNAMQSTENHRRWEKFKGVGSIVASTDSREIVDLTVKIVEVEIDQ